MVLAGPGTGKTQVLTARIARILQKAQVTPSNILALTFTNSAAKNMQERLVRLIGPTGYGVRCTTFHSFCSEVLSQFSEYFPLVGPSSEPLGDLEKLLLIERVFSGLELPYLQKAKAPKKYIREALKLISDYKREGFTPQTLAEAVEAAQSVLDQSSLAAGKRKSQQREIDKNRELSLIFDSYEKEKSLLGRYDYDDMILWVRDALQESEEMLMHYQELYQYILIDEFQDTNTAQIEVVRSLLAYWGEQANIFVVGDPHQSIYRFQGASLSNTFGFLQWYPQSEVITLRTGYRCGQSIYDAAALLLQNNGSEADDPRLKELALPLQNFVGQKGKLTLYAAPDTLAECLWLARQVETLHHSGTPYSEMAVLYRKHKHSALLRQVFDSYGIPSRREGARNVFETPLVQQLRILLKFLAVVQSGDEAGLSVPFLRLPWWNLDQMDIWKLVRSSTGPGKNRNPWQSIMNDELDVASPATRESLIKLREKVSEWVSQDGLIPPAELVERILAESNFYPFVRSQQQLHHMSAVIGFLRWLGSWSTEHSQSDLQELLQYLSMMEEQGLALSAPELLLEGDSVRFATAHQAKGQEWKHVFVLHSMSGYWDNQKKRSLLSPLESTVPYEDLSAKERNEDERRLFYVALTRAKEQVWISWSATTPSGEKLKELQRSQFVEEIASHVEEIPQMSDEHMTRELSQYFQPAQKWSENFSLDRKWLESLLKEMPLSASALNNYFRCSAAFLFQDVLKMPLGESAALAIGTAVHAALEYVAVKVNEEGQMPSLSQTEVVIRKSLSWSRLAERDRNVSVNHAAKVVKEYLASLDQPFPKTLIVEKSFGRHSPLYFGKVPLVGKIDRIEEIDQGLVRVVDYKTAKPSSRNDILGKTKTSDGHYWRQLLFYRLLAEQDPEFRYKVQEAAIIFLEPNDSGLYKSESFSFEEDEVSAFKELVEKSYDEMQTLAFLDTSPCGECDICLHLGLAHS